MRRRVSGALLALAFSTALAAPPRIDHGRFENLQLLKPTASARGVVLLLSDAGGWQRTEQQQAAALQGAGALVIGIDSRQFLAALEADGGECVYPDGDLENLSRFLQAYAQQPGYRAPLLAGTGIGAALAFATLAQAPAGTFSGGLLTDLVAPLTLKKPLCDAPAQGAPALTAPVVVLNSGRRPAPTAVLAHTPAMRQQLIATAGHTVAGTTAGVAAQVAAWQALAAQAAPAPSAPPAELGDLPLIEARAAGSNPYLAVFWSGDGGWAGIDKDVAAALNIQGVSVVGVDSLRYFWRARTPAGIAADIEAISRHYLTAWGKQKLLLVGYSQGADVLPFAVNRLSAALRPQVSLVAAMGLSDHAVFEFQLGNWVSDNNSGPETLPEVLRLRGLPFLCIYGAEEDDSICPRLPSGGSLRAVQRPGGHHFDGDYAGLARVIVSALP